MSAEHDAALVRRARAGDRTAFTMLVERHQDRVYAIALGATCNVHAAEDVAQETFLAVLRHLDTFQEGARFSTWLHRIALNKAYDQVRRQRASATDPETIARMAGGDGGRVPEQAIVRSDLLAALAQVDAAFRDAVLLVDLAGCSVDEAAAALDVAPGTVKSRVFRGRAALARQLGTDAYARASEQVSPHE